MLSLEAFGNSQIIIYLVIFILSINILFKWQKKTFFGIFYENKSNLFILLIICLIFSYIFAYRPIVGGDTFIYSHDFKIFKSNHGVVNYLEGEWVFSLLMQICSRFGDVQFFFLIVALGYNFFALWGIKRLFQNNIYGAMVFYWGAFSFFSYGVNGIRNGLACAMIICALSYVLIPKNRNWIIAGILAFLAMAIHHSTTLPVVCFAAAWFIRDIKKAIFFWGLAIFIYLLAHGIVENFFAGIGFDDRLSGYIQSSNSYAARGFKSGFRIDFLIYGFMPIWLGWYVTSKLGSKNVDITYKLLINTYIFANAFWVMLMGAAYSNRFAYLSWFLYPIVLAYPCLRMNVWGRNQGKVAGNILFFHSAFTLFMNTIYYGAIF